MNCGDNGQGSWEEQSQGQEGSSSGGQNQGQAQDGSSWGGAPKQQGNPNNGGQQPEAPSSDSGESTSNSGSYSWADLFNWLRNYRSG